MKNHLLRLLVVTAACAGLLAADAALFAPDASANNFSYKPAGQLVPGSGRGRADTTVYVRNMRFPIERAPAYLNSQVWGHGGMNGPGGGQCHANNYAYPWYDNYCETRSWTVPMCPGGKGHQGQDIRASTCENSKHNVVSTVDGKVTHIGSYSVTITPSDGTRHRFLHMSNVAVRTGQNVRKGQVIGKVSNNMGGTPTTIHLHFDLFRNGQYIPPYMSLVRSYEALIGPATPPPPPPPPPPAPGGCVPTARSGAENATFKDFLPSQTGYREAEILYREGITSGCQQSPLMYCPNCPTTRRQFAIFLARAGKVDVSNPPARPTFSDVPVGAFGYAEIEAAARMGITNGCGDGKFCPEAKITRGQAAAMLRRARGWNQVRPQRSSYIDVAPSHSHYADIETIRSRCVTNGCATNKFCPNAELPRSHAAVFIARAFNINGINSCAASPSAIVTPDDASADGTQPEPATSTPSEPPATSGGQQTGDVQVMNDCSVASLAGRAPAGGALGLGLLAMLGLVAARRRS